MKYYLTRYASILGAIILSLFISACDDGSTILDNIYAGLDQSVIVEDEVILTATVSSQNQITAYLWKEGDVTLSTDESFTKSDFSVGTHTIELTVTFDADEGAGGTRTYTSSDTVVITVNEAGNEIPVATAQTFEMLEDGEAIDFTLTGTDAETAVAGLTFRITNPIPAVRGAITGTPPNLTFTPNTNYHGTAALTFVVNDGLVDSTEAIVSFVVTPVNDAPVASSQTVSITTAGEEKSIFLTGSDVDNLAGDLIYTIVKQPTLVGSNLVKTSNHKYQYTAPAGNEDKVDSFTFTITDPDPDSAISNEATVTINITPENRSPIASAGDDQDIKESKIVLLNGDASSDSDGDPLTYKWAITSNPADSVASLSDDKIVNPLFTADLAGEYKIELVVNDGKIDSVADEVVFTVTSLPNLFSWCSTSSGEGSELWERDGRTLAKIKDIYAGEYGSSPSDFMMFNGKIFFNAEIENDLGRQLWTSEGESDNTQLFSNLYSYSSAPRELLKLNNKLFYVANDGSSGSELWVTDGIAQQTLIDINHGGDSSSPSSLTTLNDKVYFAANDGYDGYELWESDGTDGGTKLVKDINPEGSPSSIYQITKVANTLYFRANDGSTGHELWKSDGIEGGTKRVKDIVLGSGSSYPNNLIAIGDDLYFTATYEDQGNRLWRSTQAPITEAISSLKTGGEGASPRELTNVNDVLFFVSSDDESNIRKTNRSILVPITITSTENASNLTALNSNLFFTRLVGDFSELWRITGDSTTARKVEGIGMGNIHALEAVGDVLYFTMNNGQDLWIVDSITADTETAEKIATDGCSNGELY